MRRLIIIGIINLSLVALAIIGLMYFSSIKHRCSDYIEKSITYIKQDDKENAKNNVVKAKDTWEKHEKYLEIFLYHNYIEDIYLNLLQMQSLAENKSNSEFIVVSRKTLGMLDGLYKGEMPTLSRIL